MPTTPSTRAVVSELAELSEPEAADVSEDAFFAEPASSAALSSDAPWWPSPDASDRVRTGAGWSGSSCPFCGTSIQRTTSLLEYVCRALKTRSSAFSGRVPTDTGNFWKKPGSMPSPSAVQVTLVTASSIFLPCISRGLSSLDLVTFTSQPATGWGITEASGCSVGKVTSTLVVEALSRSLGTLKLTTA